MNYKDLLDRLKFEPKYAKKKVKYVIQHAVQTLLDMEYKNDMLKIDLVNQEGFEAEITELSDKLKDEVDKGRRYRKASKVSAGEHSKISEALEESCSKINNEIKKG